MKCSLVVYLILVLSLSGCIKRKPHFERTRAMLQQATLEMQAGNYSRAMQCVNDAIKLDPHLQARALRANILYYQQQFKDAAAEFLKLARDKECSPSMRADLLNNAASALFRNGDRERALAIWQDLTVDPHYVAQEVAWLNLGLAHLNLAHTTINREHELKRALQLFDRAIQISPGYVDALWYIACAYQELGDVGRARMALDALLIQAPEHQPALRLLASLPTADLPVAR